MAPIRISRGWIRIIFTFALLVSSAWAQEAPAWQSQIDDLRALLAQTRAELQRSQSEILDLRQQVSELKSRGVAAQKPDASAVGQTSTPPQPFLRNRTLPAQLLQAQAAKRVAK